MAASTKKRIHEGGKPKGKTFGKEDPESSMRKHLSWSFSQCDMDSDCRWGINKEHLSEKFWDDLFPKMLEFETMTISDIFVTGKKENHSINVDQLSKPAAARLMDLKIEAESVHSLRLGGKIRLYGVLNDAVYNIIWYDDDHGDNDRCVCRSFKKHS